MMPSCTVFARGFSYIQHDPQVFQRILLQDAAMTLLVRCSGVFQGSAEVCVEHLVHGKVVVTLEGLKCPTDHLTLLKANQKRCPPGASSQTSSFAYIKQNHSF